MTERVPPEQLFQVLVKGGAGSFSIDGLVVKRTVFEKAGLLDEHLPLHQDTAIIVKIAAVAKLVPGRLDEPAAMWRVHDHNRISAPRLPGEVYKGKLMYWNTLWCWSRGHLDEKRQRIVLDRLLSHAMFAPRFNRALPTWARGFQKRLQLILLLFDYPLLAWEASFWECFVPSPRHWGRLLYNRLAQKCQA